MAEYWFRPRRIGYGATPNTWQGWLFIVASAVVIASYVLLPQRLPLLNGVAACLIWAAGGLLLVFGFVKFTKTKTDGEWRWRNGDEG